MAASTLRTTITPGTGTITDAVGNAHTITAGGAAQANGIQAKLHNGAQMGVNPMPAITNGYYLGTGETYMKDQLGRWYHWDYTKGAYVTPGPPPGGMT